MELIVRAVDVGFGITKFVTGIGKGGEIRCADFPSRAYAWIDSSLVSAAVRRPGTMARGSPGAWASPVPKCRP